MSAGAHLSVILAEDLPALADFCSRFPDDGRSETYWTRRLRHWWPENPAWSPDWVHGAKIVDQGRIVGCTCAIPIRARLHGREQRIVVRSTWRVLPEYRSQSVALEMLANEHLFPQVNLTSTAIKATRPLLKLMGWQPMREAMPTTILAGHPLALLRQRLGRRPRPAKLPAVVAPDLPGQPAEILKAADPLWQSHAAEAGNGPVRDASYFHWMTLANPTMPFTAFAIADAESGAAQFALATDFGDGALQVTDFWPLNVPPQTWRRLIQLIVRTARRHGFHRVRLPHLSTDVPAVCRRLGILGSRIDGEQLYVHLPAGVAPVQGPWPVNSGDVGL